MLVGCVSGYNEIQFIKECLLLLRVVVDRIIYVDGAYKQYPTDSFASDDGSLEVAKSLADNVIEAEDFWPDEINKRNEYLRYLEEGDICLVVDVDEFVEGTIPKILKCDDYLVKIVRPGVGEHWIYRLFRYRKQMYYWGAHNALCCDDKLLNEKAVHKIDSLKLIHYTDLRDEVRRRKKAEYYKKLKVSEGNFRVAHGI